MSKELTYIGSIVNINNEEWRVAQKTLKYGREWQYTLSHENTDGTYNSINLNKNALEAAASPSSLSGAILSNIQADLP